MATITQHAPGTFCWPELATSDQAGARKFYTSLFGWKTNESEISDGETYTTLLKGDKSVGALYKMRPEEAKQGAPPHWNSYVAVTNADQAAAKAKGLGGKILMEPFDVMEHGRMAVIQDPTGAIFCVWQSKQHTGAGVMDEPNSLVWTELMTNDIVKASQFYNSMFGWKGDPMPMPRDPSQTYTVFKNGDKMAAGMMPIPKQATGTPPTWINYFGVENTDKSAAKAKELGGKIEMGPQDIPGIGRFAVVRDPQGAYFSIATFLPPSK